MSGSSGNVDAPVLTDARFEPEDEEDVDEDESESEEEEAYGEEGDEEADEEERNAGKLALPPPLSTLLPLPFSFSNGG